MKFLQYFFNPPGKSIGLFFTKFLLFTVLLFFAWEYIRIPYNSILRDAAHWWINNDATVAPFALDDRFSEENGTYEINFRPYSLGPIALSREEPFSVKLILSMVHMNLIPFFAFFLASPFRSFRRFCVYFSISFMCLILSHFLHIFLDINAYYFKIQIDGNYFSQVQVTILELQEVIKPWQTRIRMLILSQAFMEQAGSMLLPAFFWMIYASPWILAGVSKKSLVNSGPALPATSSPKPVMDDQESDQDHQTP